MLTTARSTLASALGLGVWQSVAAAGDSKTVAPPSPAKLARAAVWVPANVAVQRAAAPARVVGAVVPSPNVTVRFGRSGAWPVKSVSRPLGVGPESIPTLATVMLSPPGTWTVSP